MTAYILALYSVELEVIRMSIANPSFLDKQEIGEEEEKILVPFKAKIYCTIDDAYIDRQGNIHVVLFKNGKRESRDKSLKRIRDFLGKSVILEIKHWEEVK